MCFLFAFMCRFPRLHAIIQVHIVIKIALSAQTVDVSWNLASLKVSCFSENNPYADFLILIIGDTGQGSDFQLPRRVIINVFLFLADYDEKLPLLGTASMYIRSL